MTPPADFQKLDKQFFRLFDGFGLRAADGNAQPACGDPYIQQAFDELEILVAGAEQPGEGFLAIRRNMNLSRLVDEGSLLRGYRQESAG